MRTTILFFLLSAVCLGQTFSVTGDVPHPRTFAPADLQKLARTDATAQGRGGPAHYQGVSVVDLLKETGLAFDDATKPANLHRYVTVAGSDGYTVVFALQEFDPGLTAKIAVLADTKDGKPMDSREGPFHLILPDEKKPMRWVRQAISLNVVTVPVALIK